jgi:hypothetical protein
MTADDLRGVIAYAAIIPIAFLLAFGLVTVAGEVAVTDSATENLTVTEHQIVKDDGGYLLMVELTYQPSADFSGLSGPTDDTKWEESRWFAFGPYDTRQEAEQKLEEIEEEHNGGSS